jgi:predicted HTH domain antitoxin
LFKSFWIKVRKLSERISFVVPRHLKKSLKELQELTGEDQSTLLRRLLDKGLYEVKVEIAVDSYVKGKTSLTKSAEISGVSLWSFLDELRKRNVALKYSLADAESEVQKIIGRSRVRKS